MNEEKAFSLAGLEAACAVDAERVSSEMTVDRSETSFTGQSAGANWLTEENYQRVRADIAKWPDWKRAACNVGLPPYAKPF